jgi:hypothetical protein
VGRRPEPGLLMLADLRHIHREEESATQVLVS